MSHSYVLLFAQRAYAMLVRAARCSGGNPGAIIGTILSDVLAKAAVDVEAHVGPEEVAPIEA